MKVPYYFGLLILLCANASNSYSSYLDTNLVEQIKPNPMARSKPTNNYLKFASVSFLQSDTKLDFKSNEIDVAKQCAMLGYTKLASSCTGNLQPSYLCSASIDRTGAEKYTTGCCNSKVYTAENTSECGNNSAALNDSCYFGREGKRRYRCSCDRGRYPYSTKSGEGCGSLGDFNVNDTCKAPDNNGAEVTYYGSCCPSSYNECDYNKHHVGKGNSCRIKKGESVVVKYETCECSSSYDTICQNNAMIDASDYCLDPNVSGRILTRDNNCESKCTQTSETNLDSEFKDKFWHCLYKKDGASVKTEEGALCDGLVRNTSDPTKVETSKNYYDACMAQGYIKSVDDCYESKLILHCPNDTSKVWCLDSKYCTGYDVAGSDYCGYKNSAARVNFCGSQDKGIRCTYKDDRCNAPWNDGQKNASKISIYDTQYDSAGNSGDSTVCCNRGYYMNATGACVVNICDRDRFPYELYPGKDQGDLVVCYEGSNSSSTDKPLYNPYYGYTKCYTKDNSDGGMWKPADDNEHKCVCDRKDDTRGWLPFDSSLYFDTNSDASEAYIHVGFYQGYYGEQRSCTDSEGSYYGYSSCFIGSTLGTTTQNKGMCLGASGSGNTTTTPHRNDRAQGWGYLNDTLSAAGVPTMTRPYKLLSGTTVNNSNIYCINYNTHCPNGNCSADVLALTINPDTKKTCMNGYGEDCNRCYSIANLNRDSSGKPVLTNGKYTAHNKFKLRMMTYDNGSSIHAGFETCPSARPLGGITATGSGMCIKRCSKDSLSSCLPGDIVTDTAKNIDLGVMYYKDSSSAYIAGLDIKYNLQYADAAAYAASYAPNNKTYTADSRFAVGKWALPTNTQFDSTRMEQFSMYQMYTAYYYLKKSANSMEGAWTQTAVGSGHYTRNCCGATTVYNDTDKRHAVPVLVLPLK